VDVPVPDGHNGFAFVFGGAVAVGTQELSAGQLAILSRRGTVHLQGRAGTGRVLLVAGKPLHEPIAKHGPFVMNTVDELRQAVSDYQRGLF
jgi:redox-sensitive bicupin YhaK (pirin superfamily)